MALWVTFITTPASLGVLICLIARGQSMRERGMRQYAHQQKATMTDYRQGNRISTISAVVHPTICRQANLEGTSILTGIYLSVRRIYFWCDEALD